MGILDTIYTKAVSKTARPDRVNETKLAVADAINEYHSLGFFEKDIQRGVLMIGERDYGRVDLQSYLPKLRKLMAVLSKHGVKIPKISNLENMQQSGYYLLGKTLHLNPSNLLTEVILVYCQTPEPQDSWIALEYPDAVATLAAAKVAAITGNRVLAQALFLEVGGLYPVRSGFKHQIMMENTTYEPDL